MSRKSSPVSPEYRRLWYYPTKIFVTAMIEQKYVLYDPDVFDKALKDLRILMQINDADARISQFCSEFLDRLNAAG